MNPWKLRVPKSLSGFVKVAMQDARRPLFRHEGSEILSFRFAQGLSLSIYLESGGPSQTFSNYLLEALALHSYSCFHIKTGPPVHSISVPSLGRDLVRGGEKSFLLDLDGEERTLCYRAWALE